MKKLLSISMLFMLLGVFLAADLGYAAAPKGNTAEGNEKGDKRTSKKSVLNGCDMLIKKGMFIQGANFTFDEYKTLRLEYGRAATGDSKWSISDDMLRRELKSMVMLGIIAAGENGYEVQIAMDDTQEKQIDARFGTEIKSLTRKDSQRDAPIGLNSYDLVEVVKTPEEEITIKQIVGQELLTGKIIDTGDTKHPLNGVKHEQVLCLTERQLVGDNALSRDDLSQKLQVLGQGERYKLAIATKTEIKVDDTGMLTDESQPYVKKLLEALPMGYEEAKKLFDRKVIVFSYIPREDIFIQIEKMTGPLNTLNNLTPEQATAVLKNV